MYFFITSNLIWAFLRLPYFSLTFCGGTVTVVMKCYTLLTFYFYSVLCSFLMHALISTQPKAGGVALCRSWKFSLCAALSSLEICLTYSSCLCLSELMYFVWFWLFQTREFIWSCYSVSSRSGNVQGLSFRLFAFFQKLFNSLDYLLR